MFNFVIYLNVALADLPEMMYAFFIFGYVENTKK